MVYYSLILLFFPFHYGRAQQKLFPGPDVIPLAVRSPYLSCWAHIPSQLETFPFVNVPTTSDLTHVRCLPGPLPALSGVTKVAVSQTLGWTVLLRVDGTIYTLIGDYHGLDGPVLALNYTMNVTDTIITPTQTLVAARAGPIQVNFTFLNPIEPGDWVKQSIPFSYLALSAKSLDGVAHAVQAYSEVSRGWNSGGDSQTFWSTTSINNVIYHTISLLNPAVFTEISGMAEWGSFYFAMGSASNVTFSIAQYTVSRGLFALKGSLDNRTEVDYHLDSNESELIGFAISRDLGNIQATQDPIVWTVGLTTDPVINYTDISEAAPRQRSLFYKTQYSDDTSLIVDFLGDFANASSRAQKLDQKILQAAAPVSDLLGDLVSLATAQVYGSTHLTVGTDANGNYNESDVMMFMKNIGGLTKANRVNAVETLYSAFPAFMYIDPTLGRLLLEPLFRLQASPNYTIPYAAADLGASQTFGEFGSTIAEDMKDRSGNMLIMTYAHARATGDGSLISRYVRTELLSSLVRGQQKHRTVFSVHLSSADGLTTTNQTNLAIKGIIAIKAMSKMSSVVKQTTDADKYSTTSARLYSQWKSFALASDQHLFATFGEVGSWTLGYNLFADAWLDTGVVESSVSNGQSSFIDNVTLTSSFSKFGMPVDGLKTDTSVVISSWNLFVAAMTLNPDLRTNLISRVHNRASLSNVNASTLADLFPLVYDGTHGITILGVASPAQGAMYAPLALEAPVVQIAANPTATTTATSKASSSSSSKATSHTGAIAGGIAGTVAALTVVVGTIFFIQRRRRQDRFH
ncbi:hypothetical protein EDB85DRAFT_2120054, partial [Lactarius pseudohatsudake]